MTVKRLLLLPLLVLAALPAHSATLTWADPYGRAFTPSSVWAATATQGVFAGVAPLAEEGDATAGTDEPSPAPAPGPVMAISITSGGLLDFVFQQLYSSFTGAEAERIRAVLAPQYEAMAQHLQVAFGGADTVGFPEEPPPAPPVEEEEIPPAAPTAFAFKSLYLNSGSEPLTVTQSMAVVAATTLLVSPAPTVGGMSTNSLLLTGGVITSPLDTTSVPEPSTVLLVGAGLALVMMRRRA